MPAVIAVLNSHFQPTQSWRVSGTGGFHGMIDVQDEAVVICLPEAFAEAWGQCSLRPHHAGLHHSHNVGDRRRGRTDWFRFWHVIRGQVCGDFGTGQLTAGAGTGLILPPGRAYLAHEEDLGHGLEMLIVLFQIVVPFGVVNPLAGLRLPTVVAATDAPAAAGLCAAISAVSPAWVANNWSARIAIRPLLDQLLTAHLVDGFAAGAWSAAPGLPAWIADLQEQAFRRIADPTLQASNLHVLAGFSREHVARMLRLHLGTSAAGMLRRQRIKLAARLLAQGDGVSVNEVAVRVGYHDRSLFCRHFRAELGTPPSRWRAGTSGRDHGQPQMDHGRPQQD
ncbi:hypothetical protein LBMAG53_20550 [Planctomycetota bacterium]|nr:hypothetical protein LBMAG53_20550 [Planctomycetota bacterium]